MGKGGNGKKGRLNQIARERCLRKGFRPFALFPLSPFSPFPLLPFFHFPLLVLACSLLVCLVAHACHRWAEPPKPYLAFVANEDSNTVAAVNLADFHVVASIPVAAKPEQLAVRPHYHELWAVSALGTMSVIDFPTLRVVETLRMGTSARDLLFAPNGDHTY